MVRKVSKITYGHVVTTVFELAVFLAESTSFTEAMK